MDAINDLPITKPARRGYWSVFAGRFSRSNYDWRWLRALITLCAFVTVGACCLRDYHWLILPGIGAVGAMLCLYFGHLLFFRLQCSLMELMALTMVFGLIDGLVLSTPGALKMGLYLSPAVAAWILHAAVSGIVTATLCGASGIRARLLFIGAAWLGGASLGLIGLSTAVIGMSHDERLGMSGYLPWAWPMAVAGLIGMVLNIRLGMKTRRCAKAILKQSKLPASELVLITAHANDKH